MEHVAVPDQDCGGASNCVGHNYGSSELRHQPEQTSRPEGRLWYRPAPVGDLIFSAIFPFHFRLPQCRVAVTASVFPARPATSTNCLTRPGQLRRGPFGAALAGLKELVGIVERIYKEELRLLVRFVLSGFSRTTRGRNGVTSHFQKGRKICVLPYPAFWAKKKKKSTQQ